MPEPEVNYRECTEDEKNHKEYFEYCGHVNHQHEAGEEVEIQAGTVQ